MVCTGKALAEVVILIILRPTTSVVILKISFARELELVHNFGRDVGT